MWPDPGTGVATWESEILRVRQVRCSAWHWACLRALLQAAFLAPEFARTAEYSRSELRLALRPN